LTFSKKVLQKTGKPANISSFEVKTGKSSCEADLPVFSTCGIWVVKYYFFRRLIF